MHAKTGITAVGSVEVDALLLEPADVHVTAFHAKRCEFLDAIKAPKLWVKLQAIYDLWFLLRNKANMLWSKIAMHLTYVAVFLAPLKNMRIVLYVGA